MSRCSAPKSAKSRHEQMCREGQRPASRAPQKPRTLSSHPGARVAPSRPGFHLLRDSTSSPQPSHDTDGSFSNMCTPSVPRAGRCVAAPSSDSPRRSAAAGTEPPRATARSNEHHPGGHGASGAAWCALPRPVPDASSRPSGSSTLCRQPGPDCEQRRSARQRPPGPMTLSTQRYDIAIVLPMDTRQNACGLALKILEQEGDAQFSTRAVCAIANVTAPTLYHHFGSADGLVSAAVDEALSNCLKPRGSRSNRPIQRLR